MKQIFNSILLLAAIACLASCGNAPKGEKAVTDVAKEVKKAMAAKSYAVTEGSTVHWTGSKISGKHTGTFNVSGGNVDVKDGKVVGGKFTVDINSINCTDLAAGDGKEDIEGHLKSPDFFDVAKHPTSTFEITSVAGGNVTGNLTLMGTTKSISFPADITVTDTGVNVMTTDFTINRTDFGMKYGSATFIDGLKDKAINDEVGLKIELKAG